MFQRSSVVPHTIFLSLALGVLHVSSPRAEAIGFVRVDSSSFLRHDDERGDSRSTIVLGPEFSTEGSLFSAALDLKGVAFLSDRSSFTVEAGNLYVATSTKLSHLHQITLGRRVYDWSIMEDEWSLGLWSARFLWNPLSPERIGLTGAFYTYQSARWRVLAFATPLSPPERSFPIREENGKLSSESPEFVPPFERLMMMNQQIDIRYSLQYPPMQELLFRPGAGVQVRYGSQEGFWTAGTYGVMPMHQAQLAAEAGYNPQKGYVESVVHPRTLFHHLMTAEAGYRGRLWSVWASASGEAPILKSMPANWITDPMGPALLTGAGGEMRLEHFFAFRASYMGVDEDKPAPAPDSIPLNMPSRFEYSRAFRAEGRFTGVPDFTTSVSWIYDLGGSSSLLSADLLYQPGQRRSGVLNTLFGSLGRWTFGIGADMITSPGRAGFIGQYAGNDRVRGRISYAF